MHRRRKNDGVVRVDVLLIAQASIALLMITAPPDPVKILFFNTIVANREDRRGSAALKVVAIILAASALVGWELLQLLGINLGAFGIVGGLVVAGMGFEMHYNGAPSKTQGKEIEDEGPTEDESSLILPLFTPLLAGPGAIVTAITLAAQGDQVSSLVATLAGVGLVAAAVFVSFTYLGGIVSKASAQTTELLLRLGGLLLATIGVQMLLGGFVNYFGL
jgi:multiple antibiotic resistance protein